MITIKITDMKIAFISYKVQHKYTEGVTYDEDAVLLEFLKRKGLDIEMVIWNEPQVDWSGYAYSIIKSPWDYHDHIEDFYQWLEQLTQASVRLLNPAALVKWNSDKHYLSDIAAAGLPVINTVFLEKGTAPDLSTLFKELNTDQLIIKPCVSAGAKNTIRLGREDIAVQQDQIHQFLITESYMAQPFMKEIYDGEWSYLFFNGKFSHSLLKQPKNGDFRVQHYHGGTFNEAQATAAEIAAASHYVEQFAPGSLYARVDGLLCDGVLHLMELELIEPYLYLNTQADAIENYYQAVLELIGTDGK